MNPLAQRSASSQGIFQLLLARYLAGQIADQSWTQFMNAVDSGKANQEERRALARYFLELTSEGYLEAESIPREEELEAFLTEIRTDA